MIKSEMINELASALALAQAVMENAKKTSNNPFFKSKYADLAEVIAVSRPPLAENGLSIVQFPSFAEGVVSVETILMHKSGQWMSSIAGTPVVKQDAQAIGAAISYLRRYSLAAVCGIAQEDDDGNSASGKPFQVMSTKAEAVANTASAISSGTVDAIFRLIESEVLKPDALKSMFKKAGVDAVDKFTEEQGQKILGMYKNEKS
ncbi:MAG TPA: ERF family protein [Rhabdochlamydiaceae bacterium]